VVQGETGAVPGRRDKRPDQSSRAFQSLSWCDTLNVRSETITMRATVIGGQIGRRLSGDLAQPAHWQDHEKQRPRIEKPA
jgi:hypothetical protein